MSYQTVIVLFIRNSENTYEWDTANDILRLRYNTALFECRDMFFDKIHGLGILVHQFNGISVFSGSIPKLVNAYCYPNAEYYASGCCYHEVTQTWPSCSVRPAMNM